jgi:hypothetical protein
MRTPKTAARDGPKEDCGQLHREPHRPPDLPRHADEGRGAHGHTAGRHNEVDPEADEEDEEAVQGWMPLAPETFRPSARATREEKRRHAHQMRAWLSDRLEQQNEADIKAGNETTVEELAVMLARTGNVGLLRQLYPQIADFIFPPKLHRGQRYPKFKNLRLAQLAADFARRIRALWREQYSVRRCRGENAAEDLAVHILRDWFEGNARCAALIQCCRVHEAS